MLNKKRICFLFDWIRKWGGTVWLVLFCSLILNLGVSAAHRGMLQRGIAEEILRFHVLANSDSEEDQEVKYLVRDEVLDWISRRLGDCGKEEEMQFLSGHLEEVAQVADKVLRQQGFSYGAQAELITCYFPDRTYGDCTFPAGWYEALRIRLGSAQGQNWWCVLYPKLCFSDCLHAVVEEEQMEELESVLTVEEYESLLENPGEWKISFRWLPKLFGK